MRIGRCTSALLLYAGMTLGAFAFPFVAGAQNDSTLKRFGFSGYVEGYYAYDLADPPEKLRPPFYYSFNRHNEPNINLAMLKGSYLAKGFRANLALMTGTYSKYNLAAEPGILRHIYEMNVGIRLGKKNLWLDAGILPSHLGMESALGANCWNLTRSIMAENSPYYETGLKLAYGSNNSKWYAALYVLLGWQRIKPVEGNSLPSFGTHLQFKPNGKWEFNSCSFIGTDKPDSARKMRYYHDFYTIFNLSARLGFQMAFDIGAEQAFPGGSAMNTWSTAVAGIRYKWTKRFLTAVRFEYYSDPHGVIVITETGSPMDVVGLSLNADMKILPSLLWRIEGKLLHGKDVFIRDAAVVSSNQAITTSIAFSF